MCFLCCLGTVAVGRDAVVYGCEVGESVIVTGFDVVDCVCSGLPAQVADAFVPL